MEPQASLSKAVLGESLQFLQAYPEASIQLDLAAIIEGAKHAAFGPDYADQIAGSLRAAIAERRPTSLIRLGDGEGNVLGSLYQDEYPGLYAFSARQLYKLMFGARKFSDAEIEEIGSGLRAAVVDADILGIPGPDQVACTYEICAAQIANDLNSLDARGTTGSLNAVRLTRRVLQKAGRWPEVITNCYVHSALMNSYEYLFHGLPFLGVISCY